MKNQPQTRGQPPAPDPKTAMKIRGTDFVALPVANLAVAAHFYREVLGLRQEMFSEEYQWAEFDAGNVTLALHGPQPDHPHATGPVRVGLAVDDVQAAAAELATHGVRTKGPPQDWGVCQSLEIYDPDGNTLLLHHRADGTAGR